MEIKRIIIQDGEYQCDIQVSVDEWKGILLDPQFGNYKEVLLKFYAESNYKSTCKALGEKYNVSPQSFNSSITNFAKAVQKKLNQFKILGIDGKPTYWIIPMKGRYIGSHFEWTLRPELVNAMEILNMKGKHLLQEIYDGAIAQNHWVFSDWFPFYSRLIKEYTEQAINNTWTDEVFQRLIKDTTKNGISDLRQGNFEWEEFRSLKESWPEIQPLIQGIAERNQITQIEYQKVSDFLRRHTSKNRPAGTNRIIAGLLPGKMTTVVNYNFLKNVILKLKELFPDYPDLKKNRLTDNINFIQYCESNISFNEPWHVSLFAWYLKEYFEYELHSIQQKQASMQQYTDLLLTNKNLILTGAPATGKTYLAKEIAKSINAEVEFVQFHPSYDYTDFVEGLRPFKKSGSELGFELKDGLFKSFCKKALSNFIDSEKPEEQLKKEDIVLKNISDFLDKCIDDEVELILSNGNIFTVSEYTESHIRVNIPNNEITSELSLSFNELSQLLLNECKLNRVKDVRVFFNRTHNRQSDSYIFALYNHDDLRKELNITSEVQIVEKKNYVLIIDEINRAEISKVFGELFFSIDAGYRGEKGKVKTQYSNLQDENDVFSDGFYIPENVYIIGTMNDIDRSVESFDFAMRRRFAWKEINANDRTSMWDGEINSWKSEALKKMNGLNSKIEQIQGLGAAFHIGPAYFLKLKYYEGDFVQLWENHLEGVLFEYLRGLPESEKHLEELRTIFFEDIEELEGDV